MVDPVARLLLRWWWSVVAGAGWFGSEGAAVSVLHEVAAKRGPSSAGRLRAGGSIGPQGVVYELVVPGLTLVEGWQLEHFQARPPAGLTTVRRLKNGDATAMPP